MEPDFKSLQQIMLSMPTENYGQVLYLKAKAQAITLEKKRQVEKQLREEKEMAEVTFKPDIGGGGHRDPRIKTEDFLLFQGRLAHEKKEKLKRDLEKQEMEHVSFKPSILKKSEQIVAKREGKFISENVGDEVASTPVDTTEKSQKLYMESFLRREKMNRLRREKESEFTFKPQLVARAK